MTDEQSSFLSAAEREKESEIGFSKNLIHQFIVEDNAKTNANDFINPNDSHLEKGIQLFPSPEPKAERLARILTAKNPVLEAASVLLRVLADIPQNLTSIEMNFFHQLLVDEINTYTKLCEEANIRHDHKLAVRYVLCSALDEAAGDRNYGADGSKNEKIGLWSTKALLQHFHQEGYGGKTVFLIIGRLAADAEEHFNVLEVLLYILLLGFKGMYRTEIDGDRNLETIKSRIYALVSSKDGINNKKLSQHWLQPYQDKGGVLRFIPLWLVAVLLLLTLVGAFGWFKYQTVEQVTDIRHKIEAIAKEPVLKKNLGLTELLKDEIAQKQLTVLETNTKATIQIVGDQMFTSGGATLTTNSSNAIERVAKAMLDVPGAVQILGHTDSSPPSGAMLKQFPTNQKLSESRAQQVATIFLRNGVASNRIQVSGMGDTAPIGSNKTVEGRSKNRRVELIINY
jgi:type VI secretion system protein ImpK